MSLLLSDTTAALARWIAFIGTSLVIGVVMLRRVSPPDCTHPMAQRITRFAGILLLLSAIVRMAQQAILFAASPDEAPAMVNVVRQTPWGIGWQLQLLTGALLVIVPRRIAEPRPALVGTLVALAIAIVPALQGHAIGSEQLTTLAVIADALHVLAGGLWLGTLAVLLLVRRARGGFDLRDAITRFSPIALFGVATLGLTGSFAAWLHVTPFSALWSSPYGVMLLRKLVVFAAIVALGAINYKRLTPRLGDPRVTTSLWRSATAELLLGAVLLLLTAWLVATPLPGE